MLQLIALFDLTQHFVGDAKQPDILVNWCKIMLKRLAEHEIKFDDNYRLIASLPQSHRVETQLLVKVHVSRISTPPPSQSPLPTAASKPFPFPWMNAPIQSQPSQICRKTSCFAKLQENSQHHPEKTILYESKLATELSFSDFCPEKTNNKLP